MADNFGTTDNIYIESDYDNIFLIDPNKVENSLGQPMDRPIHHEDLVMYANLEAKMLPRTKLAVGSALTDAVQTTPIASINFLRPGGKTTLNNNYLNEITGLNTVDGKGTNQPSKTNVQQQNKSDDFYIKQNTINSEDTGLLGIESIRVKNTRSLTPTVEIVLIDVQGRALFEKGENSEYACFFNLPYPTFYLTLKGFYGKAIRYQLILTNFSAAFEGNTGNYRINLKFYSYKYTILAETQVGALFAVPFMYTTDYRINNTAPNSPGVNAAQVSNGNPDVTTSSVRVTKGGQTIRDVYKRYKALGLISPNLPELSFPELKARLEALEKNLQQSFGQTDFTPLSDCDTYFKLLTSLRDNVLSPNDDTSWFKKYIDQEKIFVLKSDSVGGKNGVFTYIYNNNTRASLQLQVNAYSQLKQLVDGYKVDLAKNKTLSDPGTFTIDGKKQTSKVTKINNLNIQPTIVPSAIQPPYVATGFSVGEIRGLLSSNRVVNNLVNSSSDLVGSDSVRKSLTDFNIDWAETFKIRNKREALFPEEINELAKKESIFFKPFPDNTDGTSIPPTYNFVFDGPGNFSDIIDKTFEDLSGQKEKIVLALNEFLSKKIEGNDGLGFKPTMRNIMAMIFASVEAFYRLMDDVHSQAWSQRLNPIRKNAVFDNTKSSVSTDSKNLVQQTDQNALKDIPVYPWPQYFVETNNADGERFELRYPGDPSEISRTRGNNYEVWPEVQFVEEYMKGLAQRASIDLGPNGSNNEANVISRITVNGIEFPTTNIPYSDYDSVKFIYEIYERVLLASYWDRLSTSGAKQLSIYNTLSDLEVSNIRTALNSTSPSLTKILKNFALTPQNFPLILRSISNDGTGSSWQQFIRGEFTSEYLRTITENDYAILNDSFIKSKPTTNKNVQSLTNLSNYIKSTSSTQTNIMDVYPFVITDWQNENLAGVKTSKGNVFDTTKSLFLNDTQRYITNYESADSLNNNRPFVNNCFLQTLSTPKPILSVGGSGNITGTPPTGTLAAFNQFYKDRRLNNSFLVTEGPINYQAKTGNVDALQTTSMLNTPFFINALQDGINKDRNNTNTTPYVLPAYLFLNSLPLATLREKYKNITTEDSTPLDYIFTTLTKFGGVHKLPYSWIIKYGSIWHRYKTYVETNVDILDSVWKNVNVANLYDPDGSSLQKQYTFTSINENYNIVAQDTISQPSLTLKQVQMNLGFYPKMINDTYFLVTGQELLTGYTDTDIQTAINQGLVVGAIPNAQISTQDGYSSTPNQVLKFNNFFTAFETQNSPKFKSDQQYKTLLMPSFGTIYNQVIGECFVDTITGLTQTQEVQNNKAVFNGSVRPFWAAPNFGYFELSSITKPGPNEYMKEVYPNLEIQEVVKFGQTYSKIDDVFGTFKKEILDSFEIEFLNFCKSFTDLTSEDLSNSSYANRNFQGLMSQMLLVPTVTLTSTLDNYVVDCGNAQLTQANTVVQSFVNYDVVFKYGNPSNFNRRVFGTFTTLNTTNYNKVIDPYQYKAYVQNSVPVTNGATTQITLAQSKAAYPNAWIAMETYIGFATTTGLTYSNSGSYYTDFFPTLNVEFTEGNVKNFAPLIKIFGTQKSLNNGVYTRADFTTAINDFYTNNDEYLNYVLGQLMFTLQKELPDYTQTTEKPILSAIDGMQPKIELWEAFKSFNDKWIAGSEFKDRTLYQDVMFLDRANRDIGDKVLVDVFKLKDFFSGTTSLDARIIDFVSRIIADNQFQMMPLPAYMNFWGAGEITQGNAPRPEKSNDLANSLFGTFLDVDYRESQPKFVCYYAGKPSEHLDMRENADYRWRTDAFDLSRASDNPLVSEQKSTKTDWAQSNKVVGFNVDFGIRNQSVFYSIQLDQNNAAATTEANRVITDMGNQAGGRRTNTQNVSLYNLYKNRSYECRVESMGNAMIQPTMYFNLRNVPMFRGPYMIQSVEHTISAGDFKTFFSGVRMPIYSLPLITKQLVSINANLLGQLVQILKRQKETEVASTQPTINVITIGNGIQTNVVYSSAFPSQCQADMLSTNPKYQNFLGIENTQQSISFADLAKIIRDNTTLGPARAMILYTAYVNGHDDNSVYTYNYDLGNTLLGGGSFPQQISYGGREKYFQKQFGCKVNQNGYGQPTAVFTTTTSGESFTNSVKFINDYYVNEQVLSKSLLFAPLVTTGNTGSLVWNTKKDYIDNMISIWTKYWPQNRFQTDEQWNKWVDSNKNMYDTFKKEAENVVELLAKYKLVNFK